MLCLTVCLPHNGCLVRRHTSQGQQWHRWEIAVGLTGSTLMDDCRSDTLPSVHACIGELRVVFLQSDGFGPMQSGNAICHHLSKMLMVQSQMAISNMLIIHEIPALCKRPTRQRSTSRCEKTFRRSRDGLLQASPLQGRFSRHYHAHTDLSVDMINDSFWGGSETVALIETM